MTARFVCLCLLALFACMPVAHASRIKDIAAIEGVRTNQLTGFGLVVGLDGTGDQTTQMPYTTQGLTNYLQQMGISLPADALSRLQLKNVAAVLVTAQLPAFARPGQVVDVNVSSMGNAKSLTRVQSAQSAATVSSNIAVNLEKDRSGVAGVNLDEEAAKMLQYQQAYQASGKMLQVAQNLFDTLIQSVAR